MKTKLMIAAVGAACAGLALARDPRPEELVEHPVSENLRGHEDIEWSTSYAYDLVKSGCERPRVLLVGDSICAQYQAGVRKALAGKMNVTYWASSYCVTSPGYLKLLDFYLNEADYAVVHFNNGLHSLQTPTADWAKGFEAAVRLVRARQPKAKLVWTTATPLADTAKTAKSRELNAAAAKILERYPEVAVDDLFSTLDPLDRKEYWSDPYHFKPAGVKVMVGQVSSCCLGFLGRVAENAPSK